MEEFAVEKVLDFKKKDGKDMVNIDIFHKTIYLVRDLLRFAWIFLVFAEMGWFETTNMGGTRKLELQWINFGVWNISSMYSR